MGMVDRGIASDLARLELIRLWLDRQRGFSSAVPYQLIDCPTVIYDLTGEPLFFDFPFVNNSDKIRGSIRVGATYDLPTTVVSIADVTRHLGEAVSGRLVCYAYPRIGFEDESGKLRDAATGEVVPAQGRVERLPTSEPDREGFIRWSLLEYLRQKEANGSADSWAAVEELVGEVRGSDPSLLQAGFRGTRDDLFRRLSPLAQASPLLAPSREQLVRYSSRGKGHPCFELRAQETMWTCAPASARMILAYYRYSFGEDEIAARMGTVPGYQGGTTRSAQAPAITAITGGAVQSASRDFDWPTLSGEIVANRPVKVGERGHAKVCIGFAEQLNGQGGVRARWLRIVDPYPTVVAGSHLGHYYLEDIALGVNEDLVTARLSALP